MQNVLFNSKTLHGVSSVSGSYRICIFLNIARCKYSELNSWGKKGFLIERIKVRPCFFFFFFKENGHR